MKNCSRVSCAPARGSEMERTRNNKVMWMAIAGGKREKREYIPSMRMNSKARRKHLCSKREAQLTT